MRSVVFVAALVTHAAAEPPTECGLTGCRIQMSFSDGRDGCWGEVNGEVHLVSCGGAGMWRLDGAMQNSRILLGDGQDRCVQLNDREKLVVSQCNIASPVYWDASTGAILSHEMSGTVLCASTNEQWDSASGQQTYLYMAGCYDSSGYEKSAKLRWLSSRAPVPGDTEEERDDDGENDDGTSSSWGTNILFLVVALPGVLIYRCIVLHRIEKRRHPNMTTEDFWRVAVPNHFRCFRRCPCAQDRSSCPRMQDTVMEAHTIGVVQMASAPVMATESAVTVAETPYDPNFGQPQAVTVIDSVTWTDSAATELEMATSVVTPNPPGSDVEVEVKSIFNGQQQLPKQVTVAKAATLQDLIDASSNHGLDIAMLLFGGKKLDDTTQVVGEVFADGIASGSKLTVVAVLRTEPK